VKKASRKVWTWRWPEVRGMLPHACGRRGRRSG
jgi:hypothetical protein